MNRRPNPETTSQTCDLCGLPLRYGTVNTVFSGDTYAFCCNGCRQVFTILMESTDSPNPEAFRETDLFRQCRAMGIIPGSEQELTRADNTHAEAAPLPSADDRDNVLTLKLLVSNMWCSACAWIIDESLKKTPGVVDSACNFSTDRLQVIYDPVQVTSHQIIETIGKLGYRAAEPGESEKKTESNKLFFRMND